MEKIETRGQRDHTKFGIYSMIDMPQIAARYYLSSATKVRFKLPERDELRTQVISVLFSLFIQLSCCHSSCPFRFVICPLMCSPRSLWHLRYWQTCSIKLGDGTLVIPIEGLQKGLIGIVNTCSNTIEHPWPRHIVVQNMGWEMTIAQAATASNTLVSRRSQPYPQTVTFHNGLAKA